MKLFHIVSGKRVAAVALALLGVSGLVACSSSDDFDGDEFDPPILPLPPVPVVDAFFTTVLGLVANSPDDLEPGAIEAVVVTTPEDTEPRPLG